VALGLRRPPSLPDPRTLLTAAREQLDAGSRSSPRSIPSRAVRLIPTFRPSPQVGSIGGTQSFEQMQEPGFLGHDLQPWELRPRTTHAGSMTTIASMPSRAPADSGRRLTSSHTGLAVLLAGVVVLSPPALAVSDGQSGRIQCFGRVAVVGSPEDDNLKGTPGSDVIAGMDGDDEISGAQGADRLCGNRDVDRVWGSSGNDRIRGGIGRDVLLGQAGDDLLLGGPGSDRIRGGGGADLSIGGGGDDRLIAMDGAGDDVLRGGSGTDRCVADAGDRLLNCER